MRALSKQYAQVSLHSSDFVLGEGESLHKHFLDLTVRHPGSTPLVEETAGQVAGEELCVCICVCVCVCVRMRTCELEDLVCSYNVST